MGTIKNWIKFWESKELLEYKNIKYNSWLTIKKISNIQPFTPRQYDWDVDWNGNIFTQNFKTKAAAVKFAIKWMRNHPKG